MNCSVRALVVLLLLGTPGFGFDQKPKASGAQRAARISQLVKDLDAADFKTRNKAEKELLKIGIPATKAVERATKSSSAEVRNRAIRLLEKLKMLARSFHFLDLQGKANLKMTDSFHGYAGNNLKQLPQGQQVLGRAKFKVGAKFIQLASKRAPKFPAKVSGIAVGKTANQIHFLHATGWGSPGTVADATKIGAYIVHYKDKTKAEIPIVYGEDVRDWWNHDDSRKCSRGKVAWSGSNAAAANFRGRGVPLRLYRGTWKNPSPKKEIVSIDFTSMNETISAPFCIAISLEKPAESKKGKAK